MGSGKKGPGIMTGVVDRPIFIVGMPRSGTTALRDLLVLHSDLATTTDVTRKFPVHYPLIRLIGAVVRKHRPLEAGSLWDRFVGPDSHVMHADDVTPRAEKFYRQLAGNVLRLYDKPRFLSKCPRNGLRIEFLRAIFPDAQFIHLVRDGRAVCRSVLEKRKKCGNVNQWWDAKPARWSEYARLDPVSAVAHQWLDVVNAVAESGRRLPAGQFIEVRYEDFVQDPLRFLEKLCRFCGLAWPGGDDMVAKVAGIDNRNDKWASTFDAEQVETLNEVMRPALLRYGYLP